MHGTHDELASDPKSWSVIVEHNLFRKPVSTVRDHAPQRRQRS
jgi:hypothetical protein